MNRVIIVGAGHGGVDLAFNLRKQGYKGHITLLDKSDFIPYERPPMSKAWMTGAEGPEELILRSKEAFSEANIDLKLNCELLNINRDLKLVETSTGNLDYSTLVLALGSSPRKLQISGTSLAGVHNLHTLEQATALRNDLAQASRVGVIGAGFIGLELASSAVKQGKAVTVIETAGRIMPRTSSEIISSYMLAQHRAGGTHFCFNATAEELIGSSEGHVKGLRLSDSTLVEADLVVQGVGALANGEWVSDCGLEFDRGIVVDQSLRTSDPAIFAIGDCAHFMDEEDCTIRLESIGNAADHARRVAATIAGTSIPEPDVPWFWTIQAGVRLQMAGRSDRVKEWLLMGSIEDKGFSVLGWRNHQLVYGESVNSPGDHITIRKLLETNTGPSLSTLKPIAEMGLRAALKSLA